MNYYSNNTSQKRNWHDEMNRKSYRVNSEVTVRPITEEELKKFEQFEPEPKRNVYWTTRA